MGFDNLAEALDEWCLPRSVLPASPRREGRPDELLDCIPPPFGGVGGGRGSIFVPQVVEMLALAQQILNTCLQHIGLEWFGDIGVGSAAVAFYLVLAECACGEQDDGDVAGGQIVFYVLTKLQAVHDGHHDV